MEQDGYNGLHRFAAVVQLPQWNVLKVNGRHRERWLQSMISQDVKSLPDKGGRYGCIVNVKGRVMCDFQVYNSLEDDAYFLLMQKERIDPMIEHLSKFIIAERVEMENLSTSHSIVTLQGPESARLLDDPEGDFSSIQVNDCHAVALRHSRAGLDGYDLFVARGEAAALQAALIAKGAVAMDTDVLNVARVEAAIPAYDSEMAQGVFPQEACLTDALHWTKGCYVGQEVVARLEHRGHTNKELRQIQIDSESPPNAGAKLFAPDNLNKAVGELRSSVWSPNAEASLALAMIRRAHFEPGTPLICVDGDAQHSATVTETPVRG